MQLIFSSYSGPSGILSSDGNQNTAKVPDGVRIDAFSISSHEQTQKQSLLCSNIAL